MPAGAGWQMLDDEAATEQSAAGLASRLVAGDRIWLRGPLGAGKTTWARGLWSGLGGDPIDVASPTYALVCRLTGARLPMVHADLYRLDDPAEAIDLELVETARDGLLLVEWPERAGPWLPPPTWEVELRPVDGGLRRACRVRRPDAVPEPPIPGTFAQSQPKS